MRRPGCGGGVFVGLCARWEPAYEAQRPDTMLGSVASGPWGPYACPNPNDKPVATHTHTHTPPPLHHYPNEPARRRRRGHMPPDHGLDCDQLAARPHDTPSCLLARRRPHNTPPCLLPPLRPTAGRYRNTHAACALALPVVSCRRRDPPRRRHGPITHALSLSHLLNLLQ